MMLGGPPRQPFSSAGKRAALSDPRGNLVYEYIRLISEVCPRFFVFENVANLVTATLRHRKIKDRPGQNWNLKLYENDKLNNQDDTSPLKPEELSGSAIRQILKDFSSLGYKTVFRVLDAAKYGTPQYRLRFIMIGVRDSIPPQLSEPTHGAPEYGLLPFVTLRDVIADLGSNPGPHSEYTDALAFYFRLIPPGGNWRNLPEHLKEEAMGTSYASGGGKTGFYRKLDWDAPSPTITGRANRKASAICYPEYTRPLSVSECARIQGFPGSLSESSRITTRQTQVVRKSSIY